MEKFTTQLFYAQSVSANLLVNCTSAGIGIELAIGLGIGIDLAETSAVNPLSLSNRTGFTAERRLYLFSGEIFKCAKVRNPISPAF